MILKPNKTEFMDKDMLALWTTLSPNTLEGYRLYGGTGLALYLNHRASTDFDFFRQGPVEKSHLQKIPWLKSADFTGERGMVDARIRATHRDLIINFVSIEAFNAIPPTQPPIKAKNGVDVAHPIDILANKLTALADRRLYRDFFDIATAHEQMPAILDDAIKHYLDDSMTHDSTPADLAKSLINYSFKTEYTLPDHLKNTLNRLSDKLHKLGSKENFLYYLTNKKRKKSAENELEL